jgi:hypothetical protein
MITIKKLQQVSQSSKGILIDKKYLAELGNPVAFIFKVNKDSKEIILRVMDEETEKAIIGS